MQNSLTCIYLFCRTFFGCYKCLRVVIIINYTEQWVLLILCVCGKGWISGRSFATAQAAARAYAHDWPVMKVDS